MTPAPPLPDLLAALARRVPERVQYLPAEALARIKLRCYWQRVYLDETGDIVTHVGASYLELSLREEVDSRGWEWGIEANATQATGTVWRQGNTPDHCHVAIAPIPAHALACAMVAALSREGEG